MRRDPKGPYRVMTFRGERLQKWNTTKEISSHHQVSNAIWAAQKLRRKLSKVAEEKPFTQVVVYDNAGRPIDETTGRPFETQTT